MLSRGLTRGMPLSGLRAFTRGLKLDSKQYAATSGFSKFSLELEQEIHNRLSSLPNSSKIFQNADGTTRNPSDAELKSVAALGALAGSEKRASLFDQLRMSTEQRQIFQGNNLRLDEYVSSGLRILDKIPTEDPVTGEVSWTVVREKQKEGWEGLIYYGYVPGMLIALFFALFLDKENIGDWAMEELRLRAQERYNDDMDTLNKNDASREDRDRLDALIVERIISGDYDRLHNIRKAGQDMPATLL